MNFVYKTFAHLILFADKTPTFLEKITYFVSLIGTFAPILYLLNGLGGWFTTNSQFVSFVLICLLVNMIIGVIYHNKMNTFSWKDFFIKNSEMMTVLLVVYGLLEMLRLTAGDNFIGESFKVIIQTMTLLFPISKALKNIYILQNKKFPPQFIMEKLYDFDKTGNVNDFFNIDKKEGEQ